MDEDTYAVGRLGLRMHGSHPAVAYLRSEFASVTSASPAHMSLSVGELPPLANHVRVGPMLVGEEGFRFDARPMRYQATFGPVLRLTVEPPALGLRALEPVSLQRARNWNYLSRAERFAKDILYDAFDYLSQVAQLPLGQTYIHASTVARDGQAVMFAAWGGVGKTSAMLRLVRTGWQFLSDDLAILDEHGVAHRNPKRMQIYAYNLEGDRPLRDSLLAQRSTVDRLSWNLHLRRRGPKGVRRRVTAEQLLPEARPARSAKVSLAFQLELTDARRIQTRSITATELGHRAAWTLVSELAPFSNVAAGVRSAGSSLLPTVAAVAAQTANLVEEALAGVPIHLVRIPTGTPPADLLAYLASEMRLETG